jgi:hypothetical protein
MSPSPATLKKYGLSKEEWQALYDKYQGACHVCRIVPSTGRLNIEHEHVRGWKKMKPEDRKKYVRGLACYICNHRILTRGVTIEKLQNAVDYLKQYERNKK